MKGQLLAGTKLYCIKYIHEGQTYYMHEYESHQVNYIHSQIGLYCIDELSIKHVLFSSRSEAESTIEEYIEANVSENKKTFGRLEEVDFTIEYAITGLELPDTISIEDFAIEEYVLS